jgi:hypothetical protein
MKTSVTLVALLCSAIAFGQNQQAAPKPDPVKVLLRVEGMT